MDEDVGAAVAVFEIAGQVGGRVLRGDVHLKGGPADVIRDLRQRGSLRRHVHDDDLCPVSGERLGDCRADPPRRSGDDRDPVGQWTIPVRRRHRFCRPESEDLARDVGGAAGEEEAQRGLEAAFGALSHIDKVGG